MCMRTNGSMKILQGQGTQLAIVRRGGGPCMLFPSANYAGRLRSESSHSSKQASIGL